MAVAGLRMIDGEYYRPVDEYKGRELLQSEPDAAGHHSYCIRLIGAPAMLYIGGESHRLLVPTDYGRMPYNDNRSGDTRGDLAYFIFYYRRLIDRYGTFGGNDDAVADFQRRVVESIPRAVELWRKQNS